MILWLVLIIFVGVWLWFAIVEGEIFYGFMLALVASLASLFICCGICAGVESCADIDYELAESCEISALVDNARYSHTVSGSVFLIQTRTDSTLKYSYMFYEEGRGYTFDEVNAKSCYINYTDEQPHLDIYKPYFTNGFVEWLFGCPTLTGYDYIFYLPYDAEVVDSFVIDFE